VGGQLGSNYQNLDMGIRHSRPSRMVGYLWKPPESVTASETQSGWMVGGGFEYAITYNLFHVLQI
jgi:opacity protein-like surface antigen